LKKKISFFTILAVMGILCACASGGGKKSEANRDAYDSFSAETDDYQDEVQEIPAQTKTNAAAKVRSYRIGNTGPAGGLIFYDKGSNIGGWRYLEAAPDAEEFTAIWSAHNTIVEKTRTTIGSGKQNTQLILEKLNKTEGESDTAVQKIAEMEIKGFDDWFLPSRDELNLMFENLRCKNIGNFKNDWYWSSTEAMDNNDTLGRASIQNFKNGQIAGRGTVLEPNKTNKYYVRAVRQVVGPAGNTKNLADIAAEITGSENGSINIEKILGIVLGAVLVGYLGYTLIHN